VKIAVQCTSPLLQKSLEIFLKPYLSSLKQCDIVVRDQKVNDDEHRSIYIGMNDDADIKKPFAPSELILVLQKMTAIQSDLLGDDNLITVPVALNPDVKNFEQLEVQIDLLTQEYKENILSVVKKFYEK
jgi:hypothetical protein